jgi:hypothetical protein
METIQSDAMRLVNIRITSAIEVCDWVVVHRLTEQLLELAVRGMHRNSIDNVMPSLKTTQRESESR